MLDITYYIPLHALLCAGSVLHLQLLGKPLQCIEKSLYNLPAFSYVHLDNLYVLTCLLPLIPINGNVTLTKQC